jgi:hypothetical protein
MAHMLNLMPKSLNIFRLFFCAELYCPHSSPRFFFLLRAAGEPDGTYAESDA